MTERLGFNETLLFLAIAGIGAFALGTVVFHSSNYMSATDADARESRDNVRATGSMLKDLGMIATGLALVLAAIRAEGHSTAMRAIVLILGLAIIFRMFSFAVSGGLST